MLKFFRRFRRDEEGVTAIEYGLIAALIGVAIIGGATLLGESLDAMFTNVGGQLDTAVAGSATTTSTSSTSSTTGSTTTGSTTTGSTSGG